MYQKEANRGMQPDEEAFNVPVPLTQKVKSTTDSYMLCIQLLNAVLFIVSNTGFTCLMVFLESLIFFLGTPSREQ